MIGGPPRDPQLVPEVTRDALEQCQNVLAELLGEEPEYDEARLQRVKDVVDAALGEMARRGL